MKTLKYIFFLILISFSGILSAQNLIPNPGFEEYKRDSVYYWEQTDRPYYHFESNSTRAHSGNCLNGLCIWKSQTSEYLQVKLDSPLVKDKKYNVVAYTMIDVSYNAFDTIKYLGIFFSNEKFSVSSKKTLCFNPSIYLDVYQNCLWCKTQAVYMAKGGEQYMLLGHFYELAGTYNNINDSIYQNVFLEVEKIDSQKAAEIKAETSVIEAKYKNIQEDSWNIGKVKSKQKQEKLIKEYKNALKAKKIEIQNKTLEMNKYYREKIDQIYYKNNIEPKTARSHNMFRLYFDDISVSPVKDTIIAEIKIIPLKNVFFNTGKSDLLPASFAELDIQVDFLNSNPELKIEVSGHTDNVGTEASNQLLSQNRAKAVADYLIQKGIASTRISYKGYGSTKPITTNDTEDGRAKNRRVELKVLQE